MGNNRQEKMMLTKTYKAREVVEVDRWMAIEESDLPGYINVLFGGHDQDRVVRLSLRRADWYELCRVAGPYTNDWSWQGRED
jgi:hypothetical protein